MIAQNNKIGNVRIKALLYETSEFEIYRTVKNATLLIVHSELYKRWEAERLFFSVNPFQPLNIGDTTFYHLVSDGQFALDMAKHGNILCNRHTAVTFAFVMKQMRKVTPVSLYDGIYIEEYGYILPTYTDEILSDDALLGTYLSGGQIKHFSDSDLSTMFLDSFVLKEIENITGIKRAEEVFVPRSNEPCLPKEKTNRFSLPGRPALEEFFNDHIINILNEPERYQRLGIGFPSSIILYGPPGCGKTFAVNSLVEFLGLPKYEINSASIASPYVHDTAKKISAIFDSAIQCAPSIVVIDEMESYLSSRDSYDSTNHHMEEVAEFLRQIQQAQENKVLIIAMTNMYEKIDPAILRRGRFDHHIEVGLPSKEEICSLLVNITKNIALAQDVDLTELSQKLVGKSLADISFVIKEAGLISGKSGFDTIAMAAIDSAINTLPKSEERPRIGF